MDFRNMSLLEYINSENRFFFLPDMATNGLKFLGLKSYDVYGNTENQLKLAERMDKEFPSDFIYTFCDGVIFCETLGLDILRPDYDFPSVMSHPFKDLEYLEKAKIPDPYKDGRMPKNLELYREIVKKFNKPLYVSIQGPFTLAIQLAGATHLLGEIIRNPKFVDKLVEFTTETVLRYVKAVYEAGAMYISIAEPATVTLSPDNFKKYVVPNANKIYDSIGCWKGMHICGNTTLFLDMMLDCNLDAISLDQIMDYEVVAKRVPSNKVLIGNLDPIELLGRGTVDEIIKETKELCTKMLPYNNYLCAFGCNCLNDTPDENLRAAINTVREFKRK